MDKVGANNPDCRININSEEIGKVELEIIIGSTND